MDADQLSYVRALERVERYMIVLGAAGALTGLFLQGWKWGLMFVAGALASYVNFSWLHQVVNGLGPEARPTRKRVLALFGLRYLLLAAGGYAIVKVFGMNAIGALIGLFVAVAAVMVESIYELIHAGT